jgi:hypothetical protein
MATTITSGNATNGAAISSDNTGILELKTGTGAGTTAMALDASQNVGIGQTPTAYGSTVRNVEAYIAGASGYTLVSAATASVKTEIAAAESSLLGQVGTRTNHPLMFFTNTAEKMRIETSGNVGIGTISPAYALEVKRTGVISQIAATSDTTAAYSYARYNSGGTNVVTGVISDPTTGYISVETNHPLVMRTNGTEQARITTAGLFQFNSGYGSVATAFGCRAWVNFDGTTNVGGFCTIRGSGNVTSVADNGTGLYTLNFTNAMPDTNYCYVFGNNNPDRAGALVSRSTTTFQLEQWTIETNTRADISDISVAIFR